MGTGFQITFAYKIKMLFKKIMVSKEKMSGEQWNAGLMNFKDYFTTTDRHNVFTFFPKSISSFTIEWNMCLFLQWQPWQEG